MKRAHAFAIGVAVGVTVKGHDLWALLIGVVIAFGPFILVGVHMLLRSVRRAQLRLICLTGNGPLLLTAETASLLRTAWQEGALPRCPDCGVSRELASARGRVPGHPHLPGCSMAVPMGVHVCNSHAQPNRINGMVIGSDAGWNRDAATAQAIREDWISRPQ